MNQQEQSYQLKQTSSAPVFNEAPCVIFTQVYGLKDGQVVQFNLTVRAESPNEAFDTIIDGIRYATDKYKLSTTRPETSRAPSKNNGATPINPQCPTVNPPSSGVQSPPGSNSGIVKAVRMDVVPSAEGKITLKWYSAGHQYPDIVTTRSAAKILELLQTTGESWTEEHLARVNSFTVKHTVYWRESEKMNSKGKPYKDIVSIAAG